MSYKYFENRECEYYPCHKAEQLNCLFCFCPLYGMSDCGGDFRLITGADGRKIKDCSGCIKPHDPDTGYEFVRRRIK